MNIAIICYSYAQREHHIIGYTTPQSGAFLLFPEILKVTNFKILHLWNFIYGLR